MRRREFIALVTGAALGAPLTASAQFADRLRRVGVLSTQAENDPEPRSWISAFATRLQELGWTEGQNIRIDYRWGESDETRVPRLAKELVDLQPDVLVAASSFATAALRQNTLTLPIVFAQVPDPVAAGFVTNLTRPDGNITGFTSFEFSIGGKWLQTLKECVPSISHV
jgi:putative ABC transport system substrate-binding protein